MKDRIWSLDQKWVLSDDWGNAMYFDTKDDAIEVLGRVQPAPFVEEEEPKVWATADQKLRCSGCDFEISEGSEGRYNTCNGGRWVAVI